MSKGQDAFNKHFEAAHAAATGDQVARMDPATMSMIFGFIMEGLKICFNRNGEQATMARIKEGGGLSQREVFRALMKGGYADDSTNKEQRRQCRQMAFELAGQGQKVSAEDLEAFMNDAKQSNVPADSGGDGFWNFAPALAFVGVLLIGGTASASDGFWNFEQDVKDIKREVTTLGSSVCNLATRVDDMDKKLDTLILVTQQKGTPAPPDEPQPTIAPSAKVAAVASGVTLNGKSIGDVNAYIRQNPAGYVGVIGSLELHLRQHGFGGSIGSLSRSQQQSLHNIAHAKGYSARTIYHTAASTPAPVVTLPQQSGCPNGNCARPMQSYGTTGHWKTGLFGNTRWVSK